MLPPESGSQPAPLAWVRCPDDAVELGQITGAWGVHGWIKFQSYSASAEALFCAKTWFLKPADRRGTAAAVGAVLAAEVAVAAVRAQGSGWVAALADIKDRDAAAALAKSTIWVPRSAFPPLDDAEYYWVDLIGLAVLNRSGEALGQVADLMPTGPNQVLVVRDDTGEKAQERLIPFVDAYVDAVDLTARRITVDWPLDY